MARTDRLQRLFQPALLPLAAFLAGGCSDRPVPLDGSPMADQPAADVGSAVSGPAWARIGETIEITVRVQNAGPDAADARRTGSPARVGSVAWSQMPCGTS